MELKADFYITEKLIKKCKAYLLPRKWIILSSIVAGILSHMYALTNKLATADDICALFSKGATITSGRWFLGVTSILFPDYSMPWIYGVICILILSICACLIVDFFDIKSKISGILVGVLLASFPTITGFMCYMFTAAPYCLGMLLCICGITLIKQSKLTQTLLGIVLLTLATGIYQMYFVLACSMFVVYLIKVAIIDQCDCKKVLVDSVKLFAILLASIVLYYLILKLVCLITGVQADNSEYSFSEVPFVQRLLTPYTAMFGIFFKGYFGYIRTVPSIVIHIILAIVVLVCVIHGIIECKKNIWISIILLCIWPLSVNLLYLIASSGVIHVMSQFSFITFYFLVIIMSDRYFKFRDITVLCLAIISALNIYAANTTYLEISLNYETAYSFYTSLFANISQTEGYESDMNIVFIGRPSSGIFFNESPSEEISDLVAPITDYYSTTEFINHFIGRDVSVSYVYDIPASGMSIYPSYGSIAIYNDTVYVNFS